MWIDPGSDEALTALVVFSFPFRIYVEPITQCEHLQSPPRQKSVPLVPHAAPSRNLGKAVVVVAEVLGLETAEVVVTPTLVTRGPRASGPAEHGSSPSQSLANS